MAVRELTYHASPTGEAFHNSTESIRGIMGPVGSGKSVMCCWEIFALSCSQIADPFDNVRRSKWLVIRSTYGMLEKTTIPTWLAWFPNTKMHMSAPLRGILTVAHPSGDGSTVEIRLEFVALDNDDALDNLLSFEVTGVWANEAGPIPWRFLARAYQRTGRYPKADAAKGIFYKSFGMIMDTNPPSDTSWWYKLAETQRPKGFKFFRQPPALIKREKEGVIWYEPNKGQVRGIPAAENIENHNEGWDYYLKQTTDGDHARINVFILGNYGTSVNGDPVYPEYNDRIHFVDRDIDVNWGLPLYLGTDFGRTPCSIFCQLSPMGQLRVIDEVCTLNCGITQYGKDILRPKLMNEYRMHEIPVYNFGDPAGNDKGQNDDRTAIQLLCAAGINTVASPVPNNSFMLRRESVAERLRSQVEGQPGLIVSRKCKMIRAGFQSRYYFKKLSAADSGDERVALEPEDNMFTHPHDGLQYASYGLSHPSCNSLFAGFAQTVRNGGTSGFGMRDGRTFDTRMNMDGFC